jgi:threonyl-tRNA synthetase
MYAAEDAHAERLVDLSTPLHEDVALELLTDRAPDALKVLRHSAAHVMATAVLELFPDTKLGHGPATDSGFFYDFWRPTPFTPEDLKLIEGRMAEVAARDEKFVREYEPREEGLEKFRCTSSRSSPSPARKFRSIATATSSISAEGRMYRRPAA